MFHKNKSFVRYLMYSVVSKLRLNVKYKTTYELPTAYTQVFCGQPSLA